MSFDSPGMLRPRTQASSPSLRAALLMLGCAAVAAGVPFLSNPWVYGLAALMLGCVVVPLWFASQRGQIDAFESVHIMGLRFFLYFGLGAIWTWEDPTRVAFDRYILPYIVPAAAVCVIGYLAFLGGYYAPWFRSRPSRTMIERPTSLWLVLIPGAIGFGGSMAAALWAWASWAGVAMSGAVSSLSQLSPLYYFAWGLCWMVVFSPTSTARQRWLLLILFVPASIAVLASDPTDKSGVLMLGAVPMIALWYARRHLPWKTLLVLALLMVFVVFPFANTFRLIDANIDVADRWSMTTRMISDWDSEHYAGATWIAVKHRLALINSVAAVVRDVPRWVPYAQGGTLFYPAVSLFVPRFLWPDKPKHTLGREFGVTFRVVHILDQKTSISPTVTGELYWNFDIPGVVVGMALWGFLMRVFYRRYGESAVPDPVRHAVHMVLLVLFVHFGAGIAAQVVAVVRTVLLIEAYRWIARRAGLVTLTEVAPR